MTVRKNRTIDLLVCFVFAVLGFVIGFFESNRGMNTDELVNAVVYGGELQFDIVKLVGWSSISILLTLLCMNLRTIYFVLSGYMITMIGCKDLLIELVKRDLKKKYRRSILGVVWSVLNPLLMMLVITAVFSSIFRFDIPNFPIYYLTGSVIFSFFSEATTGAMTSISDSAALIKKVYIPQYIFVFEKAAFAFVNMLFSLVAVILVMLLTNTPLTPVVLLFPIPLIYTFVFAVGVGLILAVVATFFRDMVHLYGVCLTAMNFLTPIFYPQDIIPENLQWMLKINPLAHFVDVLRRCLLYGEVPTLRANLYCIFFACGALTVGLILFKRTHDKFVLYI